jgi:uncharacterized protein
MIMFRRFAEAVFSLRWPILLGLLMITGITGAAVFRLDIDPSMETLFVKNSREYNYYRQYSDRYGSDQMIAVAMSTPDLFKQTHLRTLKDITEKVAQYPQVERVLSLSNAMDIKHKFIGVKVVPALEGVWNGERPLKEVKRDVLSNELYLNNLVSKDGKIANILIYLKPIGKNVHASGSFIEKFRKYLISLERDGVKFYVAGSPVEQYDFIKLIRRDQFTFVPLITILLIVTTYLIYRSVPCMILSMSIVFMTLTWTMGTIALSGQSLNLMTSLLAPVIMIISVVNSIYLMNVFFEIRPHQQSLKKAVALTMEQLGIPCFLTHFTTILGFISLAFNPIPAIQSFGIFSALGTFYSYLVEIILTPILLPMLPYRTRGKFNEKNFFNRVLIHFIEKLDFRWKWWIIIGTIVLTLVSLKGITKIEVDTNMVKQMKPNLPLAIATRFIDENLTGVYSLGFVLRRKDEGTFVDYLTLMRVDRFKNYLEGKPEISKVNSITTVIKKIHEAREGDHKAYRIPNEEGDLKRYFEGILESNDPEVFKIISPDLKEIRLEARMKAVGTREGAEVERTARDFLASELGNYFNYEVTGNVVLLGRMAKDLVKQQMDSFGFAFASILVLIIIIFRSVKLGLLAAIPNLFPILVVYGIMGYMHIELSTPTAMISSIVLGLVVDASIQFLYRYKLEYGHRYHYLQALHHTYRNTGQSMVVSTLILVVGFASSAFAQFRPTIHFGVLTSLTIFIALLCTLIILPVCLIVTKPFGRQKLFSKKHKDDFANPAVFKHQDQESK